MKGRREVRGLMDKFGIGACLVGRNFGGKRF